MYGEETEAPVSPVEFADYRYFVCALSNSDVQLSIIKPNTCSSTFQFSLMHEQIRGTF